MATQEASNPKLVILSPSQITKAKADSTETRKTFLRTARANEATPNVLSINTSDIPIFRKRNNLTSRLTCSTNRHSEVATAKFHGESPLMSSISPAKCSMRHNGVVAGYAVATNQGLVKSYNEDRVSIVSNIVKPMSRKEEKWPNCSYFGIYDGHGGSGCADYLRDNLHQFVIKEPSFPWNPREALKRGFENAEKHFLEMAQKDGKIVDKSGSCAIVILIIGNICYTANVGDSRAVLSG